MLTRLRKISLFSLSYSTLSVCFQSSLRAQAGCRRSPGITVQYSTVQYRELSDGCVHSISSGLKKCRTIDNRHIAGLHVTTAPFLRWVCCERLLLVLWTQNRKAGKGWDHTAQPYIVTDASLVMLL